MTSGPGPTPSCHNARRVLAGDDGSIPENRSYTWMAGNHFVLPESNRELCKYIPQNPNYMYPQYNFVLAESSNATLQEW